MFDKLVGFESNTVSEIVLNKNTFVKAHFLIWLFGPNCFHCRESKLMLHMRIWRCMVYKNAPSFVLFGWWHSIRITGVTTLPTLKVIHRNSYSWAQAICVEGPTSFWVFVWIKALFGRRLAFTSSQISHLGASNFTAGVNLFAENGALLRTCCSDWKLRWQKL
jgi:hypothetical protein